MPSARQVAELFWPLALGVAGAAVAWQYGPTLFIAAAKHGWNTPAIYGAVFNISTVYTAFLFSLYTYILTSDSKFIAAAEKTSFFQSALGLSVRAMLLGAAVSIATVPFLLTEPTPIVRDVPMAWISVWSGLAVWSFALFVQAASILTLFAKRS